MTFNGDPIFGVAYTVNTVAAPRTRQDTSFPGVDGVASMDLGQHGRETHIAGVIAAPDAATRAAYIEIIMSYYDGNGYTFIDDDNNVYPFTKIQSFTPEDRKINGVRAFVKKYSMVLFHPY